MRKPIQWGILGTRNIANQCAQGLRHLHDANLLAVGSRSQIKVNTFSRSVAASKAYGSYEDLVQDPQVDVVYVVTPHVLHKEPWRLSLESGKAVLCEKPFTLNT